MSRYLAMLVIGAGLGLGIGAMTDGVANTYAWVALLVGLALLLIRTGARPTSLGAPDTDAPAGTRPEADRRPTLAGLGSTVEQILRLAEQQAEDCRAEARQEAERILRDARLEADGIRARAADEAGGPRSGYAAPPAP